MTVVHRNSGLQRKIKEAGGRLSEFAEAFGVTRQSLVTYFHRYDAHDFERIPPNIGKVFDFINESEYLSNINLFVLQSPGCDPTKPFREDNPLKIEGKVYVKSSFVKKILGELKKEHSFPDRKGEKVYRIMRENGVTRIFFFLIDNSISEDNKNYMYLNDAKEVSSLEDIDKIAKEKSIQLERDFCYLRESSCCDDNVVLNSGIYKFDDKGAREREYEMLKDDITRALFKSKYKTPADIEKLEIIKRLLLMK